MVESCCLKLSLDRVRAVGLTGELVLVVGSTKDSGSALTVYNRIDGEVRFSYVDPDKSFNKLVCDSKRALLYSNEARSRIRLLNLQNFEMRELKVQGPVVCSEIVHHKVLFGLMKEEPQLTWYNLQTEEAERTFRVPFKNLSLEKFAQSRIIVHPKASRFVWSVEGRPDSNGFRQEWVFLDRRDGCCLLTKLVSRFHPHIEFQRGGKLSITVSDRLESATTYTHFIKTDAPMEIDRVPDFFLEQTWKTTPHPVVSRLGQKGGNFSLSSTGNHVVFWEGGAKRRESAPETKLRFFTLPEGIEFCHESFGDRISMVTTDDLGAVVVFGTYVKLFTYAD